MCEVVEISDDEDTVLSVENDLGVIPKKEGLGFDSREKAENVEASSGNNLRSSFIAMGFSSSDVDRAIAEKGEGNADLLLETLSAYSAQNKSESFDSFDSLLGEDRTKNAYGERDFSVKEESEVNSGVIDDKTASLMKMNFSSDEVGFALSRLGKDAPISQLMDVIFAARMAKKYEKYADEDSKNEALFGIMEKTLHLLEMGFSEQQISSAFENCGSDVPLQDLTNSIVAAQLGETVPKVDKNSTIYGSQSSSRPLDIKMENSSNSEPPLDNVVKTEEEGNSYNVGISDLLEKLKGKRPQVGCSDEMNNRKRPKLEFEDSSNLFGRNSTSSGKKVAATQRQLEYLLSLNEKDKPTSFNVSRSINNSSTKPPPYFLYGNVMDLPQDIWAKVSNYLNSQPEFVDAKFCSALIRREGYVHNLPTDSRSHISPRGPMTISDALPHTRNWWPSWDTRKQFSCINSENNGISHFCDSLSRMLCDAKGVLSSEQQRKVMERCDSMNLVWIGKYKLAPLDIEHVERIMGYPLDHTRVAGFSLVDRLQSLKLSFQTDTLAYHLSVLKRHASSRGGLSVLSLFTGIGGAEVALNRLGIRLKGVVSVEPCPKKRQILKNWWVNTRQRGELIQIESINKLSGNKMGNFITKFSGFDLVICQNPYTSANINDLDFSLFVEFVRVLQIVRNKMKLNK